MEVVINVFIRSNAQMPRMCLVKMKRCVIHSAAEKGEEHRVHRHSYRIITRLVRQLWHNCSMRYVTVLECPCEKLAN